MTRLMRSLGHRRPPVQIAASYILPIAARSSQARALSGYIIRLSRIIDDVIVVDGSRDEVFAAHAQSWAQHVRHVRPEMRTTNGKVAGVMTGVKAAHHDKVILADDDVRYRRRELTAMCALLDDHAVVRPQNIFLSLPWHARWDSGRSLLNRFVGGDWPGTLGVSRSALLRAGGYSGDVLFENLEMVRTMRAAGGGEAVPLDLFVGRRPPSTSHFLTQRVRQAYDEFARPGVMAGQLAILPLTALAAWFWPLGIVLGLALLLIAAEIGRRKGGGVNVYPPTAALWTIPWVVERSVTSWIALATRLFLGGVKYHDKRLKTAATPWAQLRRNTTKLTGLSGQTTRGDSTTSH